jgi:hypothetical protein
MKLTKKPSRPTSYISKLDRKRKVYKKDSPAKMKRVKVKDLEAMLDYQVGRGESYDQGHKLREYWLGRAEKTR